MRNGKLRRKSQQVELRPIAIVACEGKTEADVLEKIRQRIRLSAEIFVVEESCGDPLGVVRRAVEHRRDLTSKKLTVARTFAVFDRDEHTHYDEAKRLAELREVELGISNPCVEVWLIWLVSDHSAPIDRHEAQRLCRSKHREYDHDTCPYVGCAELSDSNIQAARQRAAAQARRHESGGDPADSNPSSSFGRVVDALLAFWPMRPSR